MASATSLIVDINRELTVTVDAEGVRWDPKRKTREQVREEVRDAIGRAEYRLQRLHAIRDSMDREENARG